MMGLILAIVNYEIEVNMKFNALDPKAVPNAIDTDRNQKAPTNLLRLIILFTTVLACFCLVMRHRYKTEWLNEYF